MGPTFVSGNMRLLAPIWADVEAENVVCGGGWCVLAFSCLPPFFFLFLLRSKPMSLGHAYYNPLWTCAYKHTQRGTSLRSKMSLNLFKSTREINHETQHEDRDE